MGPRPGPATARRPMAGRAGVGRGIARLGRAEGPKGRKSGTPRPRLSFTIPAVGSAVGSLGREPGAAFLTRMYSLIRPERLMPSFDETLI